MQQNSEDARLAGDAKMDAKTASKGGTSIQKKQWRIASKEGGKLEFYPIFEVNEESGDVEARWLQLKFLDDRGKEKVMTFNWLDIYMFVYFACNEELRRNLAARYERNVNYIPYDVTINLSDEEKALGVVKRRVELPVDELQMAIARNEAFKMLMRTKDPRAFGRSGRR